MSPVIHSRGEWISRCKEPDFLPRDISVSPPVVYGSLFTTWGDFFGNGVAQPNQRVFRSYGEAQEWARKKGILSRKDWLKASAEGKRPKDIPSNPNVTYEGDWKGWKEFLASKKCQD